MTPEYFVCHYCGNELDKPGALLFSPPLECVHEFSHNTPTLVVSKRHICEDCYNQIDDWMTDGTDKRRGVGKAINTHLQAISMRLTKVEEFLTTVEERFKKAAVPLFPDTKFPR